MKDEYKLGIALNDDVPVIELKSWAELDRWIESEQAAWGWMLPANDTNIANIGTHVQTHLSTIYSTSKSYQQTSQDLSAIAGLISLTFNGTRGYLLPSASVVGQAIIDVRKLAGDEGAATAYAFATGAITFANLANRRQLLGVLASIFPAFEESTLLAERLSKERVNAKASARTFINELKSDEDKRDARWHELLQRVGRIGRRTLRRRRTLWNEQQRQLALQQIEAINEIRAVQQTFEEAMHLQAPVKYWQDKADKHGVAEDVALKRLCWFFPISTILLGLAFWTAGSFLLTAANDKHPALYIVVSGGLVIVSTLGLWVGRILTKLYLSEHHLRNDAEERAVMTTTYLALTREDKAGDTDRQIILSALFRSTPDGIVKDDGPGDLNIAALLSRLGAK